MTMSDPLGDMLHASATVRTHAKVSSLALHHGSAAMF